METGSIFSFPKEVKNILKLSSEVAIKVNNILKEIRKSVNEIIRKEKEIRRDKKKIFELIFKFRIYSICFIFLYKILEKQKDLGLRLIKILKLTGGGKIKEEKIIKDISTLMEKVSSYYRKLEQISEEFTRKATKMLTKEDLRKFEPEIKILNKLKEEISSLLRT